MRKLNREATNHDTDRNKIDIGKANDNYFGYIFSIGSLPEAIHNVEIEDKTKFGIFAYAVNTMKSVMTDQVFNIKIETENGNYVGEASHVLVLLTNYFADKKIFEEDKDGNNTYFALSEKPTVTFTSTAMVLTAAP